MKHQVKSLVIVQELDSLLAELGAADPHGREKASGFSPGEAERLRAERARIVAGLSPELLRRYEKLRQRYPRAVVGTERGVCLGCFMLRPTAMASRAGGLETCERCGRILFRIEANAEPARPESGEKAAPTTVRAPASRGKPGRPRSSPKAGRSRRS
jgi:hypothetical protein